MPRDRNLDHVKVLAVLHYVAAGVMTFTSCLPFFYALLGAFMLLVPQNFAGGGAPPPPGLGELFLSIGGGASLYLWTVALCTLFAGRFLARQKHRTFCLVAAGLNCLWIPLGTILAVFTFLVLLRPQVKEMFDDQRTQALRQA
jgi:hypothetical protein